jgi:isopentenyl diphosphate isomerase/L-lactate dehydrogenase-like FMN-dependent dehydrogenase
MVTLDTTIIGWRPHDLDRSYLPFVHGLGVQVGISDPVFMARHNRQPIAKTELDFPYDSQKLDEAYAAGDEKVKELVYLGVEWMKEANLGLFRTWEDLNFLRENWEGPLIVKGIQCLEVCKDKAKSTYSPALMHISLLLITLRTPRKHCNSVSMASSYLTTVRLSLGAH